MIIYTYVFVIDVSRIVLYNCVQGASLSILITRRFHFPLSILLQFPAIFVASFLINCFSMFCLAEKLTCLYMGSVLGFFLKIDMLVNGLCFRLFYLPFILLLHCDCCRALPCPGLGSAYLAVIFHFWCCLILDSAFYKFQMFFQLATDN